MYMIYITLISLFLQCAAALLAIRLIRLTKKRVAWLLISIALVVMTVRRILPFYDALNGNYSMLDPYNETAAVFISTFLMLGMIKIAPIFTETRRAEAARLRAENSLRESEVNLRLAYETGNIGAWKNDIVSGTVHFDERARSHYGIDTLDTTLKALMTRVHPADLERVKAEMALAADPEKNQNGKMHLEHRIIHPDGQTHWLAVHGDVVFAGKDQRRQAVMSFGTSQEITERKIAQQKLERLNLILREAYDETIEGWARALDLRDHETEGHSRRVTDLTIQLAEEMGLSDEELIHVRRGALLHDIGKVGVPDQILLKPANLNGQEWEIMKRHPGYAYDLLSPISFLQPAIDIPYCHHEKWDGSGYPRGLKGEQIPLAARIFMVIDVWDALRSDRPYRKAWSKEESLRYIAGQVGCHFDGYIVDVFSRLVKK